MQQKTINVYNYEELDEKAKENVLKYFREQEDFYYLEEDLKEYLKQLLEENKIKVIQDLKLFYSLSYCQGDGACFIGLFNWKGYEILIKHNSHYYHERSTDIYIYKLDKDGNEKEATEKTYDSFKELYYSICRKIEKSGYEEIEYRQSEESIKELIEMNEYTFRENGEIENI